MKNPLVYSTDQNQTKQKQEPSKPSATGPIKMRLESKGRGGKDVTVLFNLPYTNEEAKNLLSTLQTMLGTGGTYKSGNLEFRGDQRQKIEEFFAKQKTKVVRAGG